MFVLLAKKNRMYMYTSQRLVLRGFLAGCSEHYFLGCSSRLRVRNSEGSYGLWFLLTSASHVAQLNAFFLFITTTLCSLHSQARLISEHFFNTT